MTSAWASEVAGRIAATLTALANPDDAPAMRRYMKDVAPFLGIRTPVRTASLRAVWAAVPTPVEADVADVVRLLWAMPEREFQYAACDLLGRFLTRTCGPGFLEGTVEELIVTKSWWDTVDSLRSCAVGPLVAAHPELRSVMQHWSASGDRWLVRSAVIHQLGFKAHTDEALLFELCRRHGGDREFFVAKAIGWALRQYAYAAPEAVRAFVAATPLQPLSVREATRRL